MKCKSLWIKASAKCVNVNVCVYGSNELKCVFLFLRSLSVCVSCSKELKCVFLVLMSLNVCVAGSKELKCVCFWF